MGKGELYIYWVCQKDFRKNLELWRAGLYLIPLCVLGGQSELVLNKY